MNCLDLLIQQHREVDSLFDQINAAPTEGLRYSLFEQVAEALAMHAKLEEQIFYPAVKFDDTMELLKDSVNEHRGATRLLIDLMESESEDDAFDAELHDLVNSVMHHVNEEENELFPKVRQHLDERRLDEIGNQLQALMNQLSKEDDIAENLQEETGAPAEF